MDSGRNIGGRDQAWKYCTHVEGNRNGTVCNYYGLVIRNDGITRFKFHLSHSNPHSYTKKMPKCASGSETRCDVPIFGDPVDNPSTHRISIISRLALKSWYQTSTNYPWAPSYLTPLPYIPSPGLILSYLNLKYKKKMNNYSL